MNFLQLLEEQLRQQRPAFQPTAVDSLLEPRPSATMSEYSPDTFTPNAEGLSLLSRVALGFAPGAGVGDFLGQFPDAEGGLEPSALENWAMGNYGTTVLQSLGAAGDAAMLVPGLGLLGAIAKAPRVAQISARTARSAPEGLLNSNKQIDNLNPAYHGTSPSAARAIEKDGFDLSMSADGSVWLTSNPNIGEVAATGKGGVVKRMIDENNLKLGGWEETDRYLNDELIQMGYDGLKLVDDGVITYQIFNPQKLIKP